MSLKLFEQIKRLLHIANHTIAPLNYYDKYDLQVAASHTFRIKDKPAPVGYKIVTVCDARFTIALLPESRVSSNPNAATFTPA
ncbi:hypothetical protein BG000_004879, partial [Podila horticola]